VLIATTEAGPAGLANLADEFPPYTPRPPNAPLALQGIRVIDFSHFIAGPLAAMFLADLGADVIKIEPPGRGDDLRYYPPVLPELPDQGGPFLWGNRSKRSVALDLKNPAAVEVVRRLVQGADVLVENFSTGVMHRLGLGPEELRAANPRLVYCSISAYGREGPFADRAGFDPVVQAESGFVSMNGYADRQGVRASAAVMDISTAMMVSNAVLAALFARTQLGQGQFVEVGLFDTGLLMTGWAPMQHLLTGRAPQRSGNVSVDTCPSGVFDASDQSFYINCGNSKIFQRLMTQVLGRPDIANDPAFAQPQDRVARRDELFAVLAEAFAHEPWAHWQRLMREAHVPCGVVNTVPQAIRSPQARARQAVSWIPHAGVGRVPNIASPWRFGLTPVADPKAAPHVGEHTQEVLSELLGCDEAALQALAATGAFGSVNGVGNQGSVGNAGSAGSAGSAGRVETPGPAP
jgi:crotonobetainyl-CoA:carnitine CoA-transferase CaiB-like acyl-CoA transferase